MKKKLLSILMVVAIVFSLTPTMAFALEVGGVTLPDDAKNVAIVHTNDTHGRIIGTADDKIIGFSKIAGKLDELRAVANLDVLTLDAGDSMHGLPAATLSKGDVIVQLLNMMKYDAVTFGNHDFNYGYERTKEIANDLNADALAANVLKDGNPIFGEYKVYTKNGVKIGVFGLATPETVYKSNPKNTEGLTFEDPVVTAKRMVTKLRDDEKVDVVVALTHLGYQEGDNTSDKLANEVTGIDLIVDGHSHTKIQEGIKVKDTWIVQAGGNGENLGITYLSVKDGTVTIKPTLLSKSDFDAVTENADVADLIKKIEADNKVILDEVAGVAEVELDGVRENVRTKETNLGDLLTEAMLGETGADLAFTNGGGIRASIPKGEITRGHIVTTLPFGNQVTTVVIKGANILQAIEHGIKDYPAASGGFPQIAGMTFKFDPEQPAGSRVFDVKVGGEALDPEKEYTVATNDFMAVGGDDYKMLVSSKTVTFEALDTVLFNHIKAKEAVNIAVDGRITVEKKPVTGHIISSGSVSDEVTVELWQDGEKKHTQTCSTTYDISSVPTGTYTMMVSKSKHATREYTINLGCEALPDVKLGLIGDVDMSGELNMLDIQKIFAFIKNSSSITDEYQKKLADVDENKIYNMLDIQCLFNAIKEA